VPIAGTLADEYLRATRALTLPPHVDQRVLRFHPACTFGLGVTPCLIALYRDIHTDQPVAIHRIAITPDGKKVGRMMLGPVGGAAIKLSADEDVTMGLTIGEGLETVLAGMVFGFAPAWALGSSGGIERFPVLAGIDALTILGEPDKSSERAVRECFTQWSAAGREVFRVTTEAGDMNDALVA
jgi:hypothetical protein